MVRATLRGLLEDTVTVRIKDSYAVKNLSARRQNSTEQGPVPNEYIIGAVKRDSPAGEVRIRLWDSPVKKTDTADRQNIAVEGIAMKNPGAGIQDRGESL
jgi:putative N-acetylmannosamine-6-phosphate epimerase